MKLQDWFSCHPITSSGDRLRSRDLHYSCNIICHIFANTSHRTQPHTGFDLVILRISRPIQICNKLISSDISDVISHSSPDPLQTFLPKQIHSDTFHLIYVIQNYSIFLIQCTPVFACPTAGYSLWQNDTYKKHITNTTTGVVDTCNGKR